MGSVSINFAPCSNFEQMRKMTDLRLISCIMKQQFYASWRKILKSVPSWCVEKISVNCILSILLTVNRCSFDVWAVIKCHGEVVNLFVVHFPEIRLICSQCSDGRLFPALA